MPLSGQGEANMATVLITGSARGIGFQLAKQYAAAGHRVFATCRNPDRADALRGIAAGSNDLLSIHPMDVSRLESVRGAAAEIGALPIDILINNAGVWGGLAGQVLDNMDYDNWFYEFSTMAMGPFRVVQSFLDNVLAGQQKKIFTITSQTSAHSYKKVAGYSYSSSKAASNRVMTMLARDLQDRGVTVCLMHPGWVRTEMAGSVADIEPYESAAGIMRVIAAATLADSGKFLKWDGGIHDW
jgi:NAD(P)-dependent dehydrogenase (short-subunit alcohol dehydrogenase family)